MAQATTFDAKSVTVTVGGVYLTGFAESMVEIEKDEDNYEVKVGAQGDTVTVRNLESKRDIHAQVVAENRVQVRF